MSANVANEVDTDATGPAIVHVAIEPERSKVSLKFTAEERCRLAAASVTGALRAEENDGGMGTRP